MLFRISTVLSLALLLVTGVQAAEKEKKAPQSPSAMILKGIELTAEQKTKVEAIDNEYAPKVAEANKAILAVMTDEQKAAAKEAGKAAKAAGKKGKEMKAAVEAAVTLTAEQQTKTETLKSDLKKLQVEVKEKVLGVLTDEQRSKLTEKKPKA